MKLPQKAISAIRRSPPVRITIEARGIIEKTADFVSAISDLHKEKRNRKFWYRGLSRCDYALTPSGGRPHTYAGKTKALTELTRSVCFTDFVGVCTRISGGQYPLERHFFWRDTISFPPVCSIGQPMRFALCISLASHISTRTRRSG